MFDDNPYQPTPAEIADFDQGLAETNDMLDAIIGAYTIARTQFGRETTVVALAQSLTKRADSIEAACQYLAVAVDRIHALSSTIKPIPKDSD